MTALSDPLAPQGGKPKRIQLSRKKGWRMPEGAVKVDRTTRWGNPFLVSNAVAAGRFDVGAKVGGRWIGVPSVEDAVECFREMLKCEGQTADAFRAALPELRGKDLACWCALDAPCHADVLLELANA